MNHAFDHTPLLRILALSPFACLAFAPAAPPGGVEHEVVTALFALAIALTGYSGLSSFLRPGLAASPEGEAASSVVPAMEENKRRGGIELIAVAAPLVTEASASETDASRRISKPFTTGARLGVSCARHAPNSMTLRVGEGGKQIWGSPADRRPPTPSLRI